jgi:tryptophan 6-halogenase
VFDNRKRVLIVGGGTAGWMTAAYLAKIFGERLKLTLVESASIPTIGVGEASFRSIKGFFDALELGESEWMPACQATYKLSIRFVNWNANSRVFHHPFEAPTSIGGFALADWWLKLRRDTQPYDTSCFVVPTLCEHKRSPRYLNGQVFDQRVQFLFDSAHEDEERTIGVTLEEYSSYPYGYHFDAAQLAQFLSRYAVGMGVRRILDTVRAVELNDAGYISSIVTESHGPLAADLYIDCTGFRGLLINQALEEPFMSFADMLPNDRAIAARIPYDSTQAEINPYTTATAMKAGWVWNIPLYSRAGTGYVYSSAFLPSDEAETEFRQHLGHQGERVEVNHIKMRVGRSRKSWVKNCVAIGLSSGFVEPLESTGIFFIQHGIEELANHFPFHGDDAVKQLSYNTVVNNCMDRIRDFLVIHYAASNRRDTEYWRSLGSLVLHDDLADRLRIWQEYAPNQKNIPPEFHGFQVYSYTCILFGLGYLPRRTRALLDHKDEKLGLRALDRKQQLANRLVGALPSHRQYVAYMRSERAFDGLQSSSYMQPG